MRLLLLENILRSSFPLMEIMDYKYFMVIMKISLANNVTKTQLGMAIVPMTYTCILDLIYSLSLRTLSNFQADMIFIITHALMFCKKFTFTHLHSLLWWIFFVSTFLQVRRIVCLSIQLPADRTEENQIPYEYNLLSLNHSSYWRLLE